MKSREEIARGAAEEILRVIKSGNEFAVAGIVEEALNSAALEPWMIVAANDINVAFVRKEIKQIGDTAKIIERCYRNRRYIAALEQCSLGAQGQKK